MCPLRYIIFFFSALLALGVVVWANITSTDFENELLEEEEEFKGAETTQEKKNRSKSACPFANLQTEYKVKSYFDLFNGKYLYYSYKAWRRNRELKLQCPVASSSGGKVKVN